MVRFSPQAHLIAQGLKRCKACGEVKPLTEFYKASRGSSPAGGVAVDCKLCARISRRSSFLTRTYGISIDEYKALLHKQKGVCAICRGVNKRVGRDGKTITPMYVDHDHDTGAVRALLCHHCNTAIGNFNHDIQLLLAAIEYLRQPRLF